MKKLLIVYHSITGAAKAMAWAVHDGAQSDGGVVVQLVHAGECSEELLLSADAFVFVCPETLGSMAGLMKDFFDRTYYPVLEQLNGKPCALLVSAGSDGSGAVRQLQRICAGWRLRLVADPLIVCTYAQTQAEILAPKILGQTQLQPCHDLGVAMSAGLAMGLY